MFFLFLGSDRSSRSGLLFKKISLSIYPLPPKKKKKTSLFMQTWAELPLDGDEVADWPLCLKFYSLVTLFFDCSFIVMLSGYRNISITGHISSSLLSCHMLLYEQLKCLLS